MTVAELEQRVAELEKAVTQIQKRMASGKAPGRRWWIEDAGRFANDPVFDEIVRLGKAYRDSLKPKKRKTRRARS